MTSNNIINIKNQILERVAYLRKCCILTSYFSEFFRFTTAPVQKRETLVIAQKDGPSSELID
jgi:hypothetical protein